MDDFPQYDLEHCQSPLWKLDADALREQLLAKGLDLQFVSDRHARLFVITDHRGKNTRCLFCRCG